MGLLETIKNKLEQLADIELENFNCPYLYGEVELPEWRSYVSI